MHLVIKKIVHDNFFFLLMITIASCIIRVLFFLAFTQHNDNAWLFIDSQQYLLIAKNILAHKGYCLHSSVPTYYRLPGYPLFLVAGFTLFSNSLFATLLLQVFLASFIPVGIFLLSCVLFPQTMAYARCAALVATVYAGFIIYAGIIDTESLCLLFLLLFFILFFYALDHVNRVKLLFLSGIFLGLASLVRPIGHYILVLALIYVVVGQTALKSSLSLFIGWLIPVSPWLIRNFLLTGALFFHSLPGVHFLQFTAAPVVASVSSVSYVQARAQLFNELESKKVVNDYQKCRKAEQLACDYVRKYPKQALIHSSIQIFKTCAGLYATQIILTDTHEWPDYFRKPQSLWSKIKRYFVPQVKTKWLIPFIYWEILLYPVILLGCLFCFVSAGWQKNVLYMLGRTVPFASLLIVLTVAYGCARLRFSAEPFLIIWSSVGWQQILKKLF